MRISLGLDVGAVSVKLAALGAPEHFPLFERLAADECWMSDISEWIAYTNMEEVRNLRLARRAFSWDMLKSKLRSRVQHKDEHALRRLFSEDSLGYEEPAVEQVLNLAQPYLPFPGAEGEKW